MLAIFVWLIGKFTSIQEYRDFILVEGSRGLQKVLDWILNNYARTCCWLVLEASLYVRFGFSVENFLLEYFMLCRDFCVTTTENMLEL